MFTNVVVLGASGFIGKRLCQYWEDRYGACIDRMTSQQVDLTQSESVTSLSRCMKADTLLVVTVRSVSSQPWDAFLRDVLIMQNVARLIRDYPPRHCLFLSSTSVYNDSASHYTIPETAPYAPTTPYGAAKVIGELLLKEAAVTTRVPLLVLRPCMIYGPGDTSTAYGPACFIRSLLNEGRVVLFGDGSERRDYLYIDDFVTIVDSLVSSRTTGIINVATGSTICFRELAVMLREIAGVPVEIQSIPRNCSHADQTVDVSRLSQVVDSFSWMPLQEGLEKTIRFFRSQGGED